MVAQWSSYCYRMNACVEVTYVYNTLILYHFQRSWWKKYTLKIYYITVITHILIQQNYHCTTVLAVTRVYCKPCAMMVTDFHSKHFAIVVTGVHCKHLATVVAGVHCKPCAMMIIAVQCWPLTLNHNGDLGLFRPWADYLSCTMMVTGVHRKLSPCDMAATSVCSAMFRNTSFYVIAPCQLAARHPRAHADYVLQAQQNANIGGNECKHEQNILSSNGMHQKRLQVQRMCWQQEYSLASSQSVRYVKHTSKNGVFEQTHTPKHAHAHSVTIK